jgi:hypothetical protein
MMTNKCRNRNSAQPSQKSQVLFFGGDGFDFFLFPLSLHQVPKGFSTSSQRVPKVFNVFPMAPHFYPICFAKVVLFVMDIAVMQA